MTPHPEVALPEPVEMVEVYLDHGPTLRETRDELYTREQMLAYGAACVSALASSAEPVALDYVPGLLDQTCPPKIWLQIDTSGDNEDRSEAFPESEWGDLTWCYESIGGQEVVYIRADLIPNAPPALPVESLAEKFEAMNARGDVWVTTIAAAALCRNQPAEPVASVPDGVYLSGPMSGLPDLNFPAFHAAAKELRTNGHRVISPAEINAAHPGEWASCMRADIRALCDCETLALLPGWESSRGAHLELHIAHRLGIKIAPIADLMFTTVPTNQEGAAP